MKENFCPDRLKAARERLGITMAEAARRLKMSPIGYCRYEHGERTPSQQMVEVISRCLGTSSDYLYGKTSDISPDYIIVYKSEHESLFNLVVECFDANDRTINMLTEFYHEINKS